MEVEMFRNKLVELRENRGKRGVSQAHLARRIGISRAYMSRIEKGKQVPSPKIMFCLAQYFECPIEDIFTYMPD